MDLISLVQFLTPCLPFLLKLGDKTAEKVAEKMGEDGWGKAKAIWAKLHPRVEVKEAAKEAVVDLAANPEDEDLQTALRVQLKKILDSDPALAAEVTQLFQDATDAGASGTNIQVSLLGTDNVGIGLVQGSSKAIGRVEGDVTM